MTRATRDSEVVRSIERLRGRTILRADLRPVIARGWSWLTATPKRRKRGRLGSITLGVMALAGLVVAVALLLPMGKPDYQKGRMDRVFTYTLLTDQFNDLPIEERLRLIGMLRERLESMSSGDSKLLVAFAAGIAGAAREQLQENVSRLLIDTWDMYASDYVSVPEEERGQYIDDAAIALHKLMDTLGGSTREMSDGERLDEMRQQAARDMETMRDPENRPDSQQAAWLFKFMNSDVGGHATAQQRLRGQQMWRDMTRRLRGQDLATGKGPG